MERLRDFLDSNVGLFVFGLNVFALTGLVRIAIQTVRLGHPWPRLLLLSVVMLLMVDYLSIVFYRAGRPEFILIGVILFTVWMLALGWRGR